jgi:hypothetical protein
MKSTRTIVLGAGRQLDIAPATFATLLRDAGAREPWANAEAPEKFAEAITFRFPDPVKPARSGFRRAQDAIDELRRTLPEIIGSYESMSLAISMNERLPPERQTAAVESLSSELAVLENLQRALPSKPIFESKSPVRGWRHDAARLFGLYCAFVDTTSGMSADGPAVRFITSALGKMGHKPSPTRAAIAKALQQNRKLRAGWSGKNRS